MSAILQLQTLGQSIWLDHITRELLTRGTLARDIRDLGVSGVTSNPALFDRALEEGRAYDDAIAAKTRAGKSSEALFFELALEDLVQAADLFRPIHEASAGRDGWVSLEVSPLLADDTAATVQAARRLFGRARRPNLFVKIPGTPAGLPAIEAAIFAGVPVNVTLLFSPQHYLAAAGAYQRGIEHRLAVGLDPQVASVASIFISRWDTAAAEKGSAGAPDPLRDSLGIAIGRRTYRAYRELLASKRWRALAAAGARPQRLLWASTGSTDPAAVDTRYIEALAAPDTINTMSETTLLAVAARGKVGKPMPVDGGNADWVLAQYVGDGIDEAALADTLQRQGKAAVARAWRALLGRVAEKRDLLTHAEAP